ncbi:peptidase dimerization domain-containing protein [Pseudorhodoferax soli]|uniref:Peptidase-like protein n=1 Tax=Pseudorhodoferax soli TaxID=545864 RepID=A0A368XE58_9BURK|nr:peptidase dimerization domain-containing protein [Pseudorhodoferax soli]RCW64747.1 peptidase-like protein [Pseudorhodoferax soli]
MKKTIASLLCLAALGMASAHAAGQTSIVVEFQGPGGHSNGAYGRTSAVHAAGRALVKLKGAGLPVGSYSVSGLNGGNSVNSIASDARYTVTALSSDPGVQAAIAQQVAATAKAGADAENAFRGVKEGDTAGGARADIRYTVAPQ